MNVLAQSGRLFLNFLTTARSAIVIVATAASVYGVSSLLSDDSVSPLWMIWWTISGCYSVALGETLFRRWMESKKKALDDSLLTPSGFSWVVYTTDGARIGEVSEPVYLKAKFEVDTCMVTMALQFLNCLWVAWATLVRAATLMPSLMIFAALIYHLAGANGSLAELTLGQVLESGVLWSTFACLFVMVFLVSIFSGPSRMPGYKNFYELRLRRLLSRHLPNIANANGFSVTGLKIDFGGGAGSCR